MTRVVSTSRRAELAASVADLNDLVLFAELDDDELAQLTSSVTSLLNGHDGTRRAPWWESEVPSSDYNRRSPFTGDENPRSLRMQISHGGSDVTRAVGEVEVGHAFTGPPGVVHGGVMSGLFDEVIGWLAALADPTVMIVTGRLSVRYRKPTPVGEALEFHAHVVKQTPRLVEVEAECRVGSTVTATAEALMIVRR